MATVGEASTGVRPGVRNLITDVGDLLVGGAHDERVRTGVTVVRRRAGRMVCAVDVRGGGPGARETDALAPHTLVDAVDAVVLSGGSVYGLAAADGVTAELGARGAGFQLIALAGVPPSPVVPSAILYDLANGGDKAWGATPPYRELGAAALAAADADFTLGRAGAGFGARAGSGTGGLGSASAVTSDGFTVGALVAVNCFGAVRMPGTGAFWAWPFEQMWDGAPEFGGARPWDEHSDRGDAAGREALDLEDWGQAKVDPRALAAAARPNTTIAVVAVDAALTPASAQRLAIMAQDGFARAIRPVHTPLDGDIVFAVATGDGPPVADPFLIARLGSLAADCLARAVARGVWIAERADAAG